MRIAMTTEIHTPMINGVLVSVDQLVKGLRARGHFVIRIGPDHPRRTPSDGFVAIPSLPIPGPQGYRWAVSYPSRIERVIEKYSIDLIHHHHPFNLAWQSLSVPIPQVVTFHTLLEHYVHYFPVVPDPFKRRATVWWSRWLLNQMDGVIAPTQGTKDILVKYGVHRRIDVIPTDCETVPVPPTFVLNQYGIDPNRKIILYVGRLAKEKNLPLLFDAFTLLVQMGSTAQLVVVGDGPERSSLEDLVRKAGLPVIFTGMLPHTTALGMYQLADAFAFPSLSETQGLVVHEAALSGLPIVAVHSLATDELFANGSYGILTDALPLSFAQGLTTILGLPKTNNHRPVHIDQQTMAEKTERLYQDILRVRQTV